MTENKKRKGGGTGRNADRAKGHRLHFGRSEPMCRTTYRVEGGDGPPCPDSTDHEISGRRRTECRKLQKLRETIVDKKKPPAKIKSEKETERKPGFHEASVSTLKGSTTIPSFKKEFKISSQTGNSRQKDRLSFTSLAHQINAGLNRGYQEKEVI